MAKKILVHGSGHKAASWKETVSCMDGKEDLLSGPVCPACRENSKLSEPLWGVCRIL